MKKKIFFVGSDARNRAVYEDGNKKKYVMKEGDRGEEPEIIGLADHKPVTEQYDFVYVPVYMSRRQIQEGTAAERICPLCGQATRIYFNGDELDRYGRYCNSYRGQIPHIQKLFPERTKEERELMITGYCYRCQDMIFGEERFRLLAKAEFPVEEGGLVAYNRADHDGYRWWSNWFPEKGTDGNRRLMKEMDDFRDYLLDDMLGKGIIDIPKLGEILGIQPSEDREYRLYCEGEYCNYVVRLINRQKDYNVYIKVYDAEA